MNVPKHFSAQQSLPEQVLYVLTLLNKATAEQIAMELMELKGVATEEGVANLNREVENVLRKLHDKHLVKQSTEPDKKVHYFFVRI